MKTLLFIKCWLLEGVNQNTGEIYYRTTTKFNRPLQSDTINLGNSSYSKMIPGVQNTKTTIHTWFHNDMTEKIFNDTIQLNDNSSQFYVHIPKDDTKPCIFVTQDQYHSLTSQDETTSSEQPTT